jgi:hypothetical protein
VLAHGFAQIEQGVGQALQATVAPDQWGDAQDPVLIAALLNRLVAGAYPHGPD